MLLPAWIAEERESRQLCIPPLPGSAAVPVCLRLLPLGTSFKLGTQRSGNMFVYVWPEMLEMKVLLSKEEGDLKG